MIADGVSQVWWAVITAVAVSATLGTLVLGRRAFRWLIGRAKSGYLEWFAEAVDKLVQPHFDAIAESAAGAAIELKREAADAATVVAVQAKHDTDAFREDLRLHTREEGKLVRDVVREELEPIREDLFELKRVVVAHLKSDEENFSAGREALQVGQDALVQELQVIRASLPAPT